MILIFGGTTEGRVAAAVCDEATKGYLYSTKSGDQRLVANYAEQISGALSREQMLQLAEDQGVELIVDAAHPYAEELHSNIAWAASQCDIPTIRYERKSSETNYDKIIYFDALSDAVAYLKCQNISDILALTGVKSAKLLAPISESNRVTLRIMDREDSALQIEQANFPSENLVYYNFDGENDDFQLCKSLGIKVILTKESGESGGYSKKVKLARSLNIPLLVIKRPALPEFHSTVYGKYGLRRSIEQILPKYFDLRTGFTTGTAATAATIAALYYKFTGEILHEVEILLPNQEPFKVAIKSVGDGIATVIKDGGDDPDATHNIEIVSRVNICNTARCIEVVGGVGVGRVTLPGLGIEVGEAAINPVPREMIITNVERLLNQFDLECGVSVEISVPDGEIIAKNTFNPRLGIVDGISILGTSGIVQPFSSAAFLESIERQVEVVKALGYKEIVINSGAMSERHIKSHYPDFASQCYIQYGNMIGATIEVASRCGVERVVLGVMIGKAVKLAAGALDTHSKNVVIDLDFLALVAKEAGCPEDIIGQIIHIKTARQLWNIIPKSERCFFELIKSRCYNVCKPLLQNGNLEVLLISESGEVI